MVISIQSKLQQRLLAVAWFVTSACSGAPPPPPAPVPACDRVETIRLDFSAMPELNPDREGYPRSVVVRVYQLGSEEAFMRGGFDEVWQQPAQVAMPPAVAGAEELTLIPGRAETRLLKRDPKATHLGFAAKFREHHPMSAWRASAALPTPKDPCANPAGPHVAIELMNYSMRLR